MNYIKYMRFLLLLIILIFRSFTSFGDTGAGADLIPFSTDDDKMSIYPYLYSGETYSSLKQRLPELTPLRAEAAGRGLAEAYIDTEVFGYNVRIELNFKDKVYYNFYYIIKPGDKDEALAVYSLFQKYFSGRFGDFTEEDVQEEPSYRVVSSLWQSEDSEVVLIQNISGNTVITIGMGRSSRKK